MSERNYKSKSRSNSMYKISSKKVFQLNITKLERIHNKKNCLKKQLSLASNKNLFLTKWQRK